MMTLSTNHLSSLTLHSADIIIVPDLKILHPPNQSFLLLGDLRELLLKPPLVSLALHLLPPQVLELLGQLMEALEVGLVLHLQSVELL